MVSFVSPFECDTYLQAKVPDNIDGASWFVFLAVKKIELSTVLHLTRLWQLGHGAGGRGVGGEMERCVVGIYIEMERCEKCVGVICENRGAGCVWKERGRRCVVVCACEKMRRWFKTGRAGGVVVPFRLSF